MRLSFDLDGVICDLRGSTLAVAHTLHRAGLMGEEELRAIYAKAPLKESPYIYLAPGDTFIIVTGRLPSTQTWTREWLASYGLGDVLLFFVSDDFVAGLRDAGQEVNATLATADRKADVIANNAVELHVDNNVEIVKRIRARGYAAMCIRR